MVRMTFIRGPNEWFEWHSFADQMNGSNEWFEWHSFADQMNGSNDIHSNQTVCITRWTILLTMLNNLTMRELILMLHNWTLHEISFTVGTWRRASCNEWYVVPLRLRRARPCVPVQSWPASTLGKPNSQMASWPSLSNHPLWEYIYIYIYIWFATYIDTCLSRCYTT